MCFLSHEFSKMPVMYIVNPKFAETYFGLSNEIFFAINDDIWFAANVLFDRNPDMTFTEKKEKWTAGHIALLDKSFNDSDLVNSWFDKTKKVIARLEPWYVLKPDLIVNPVLKRKIMKLLRNKN